MVDMKSVLVTIVSAKTKYYEKLIISQQIISVRSNVITVVSPVQLSLWKLVLPLLPTSIVTAHWSHRKSLLHLAISIASSMSSDKLDLRAQAMQPAALKHLSIAAEVAGTEWCFRWSLYSIGYCSLCCAQNVNLTAGLCELSHRPETSVTGHLLNVKFDSNFYRANYCTN